MSGLFPGLEIGKRSLIMPPQAKCIARHDIAAVNTPDRVEQPAFPENTIPLHPRHGQIGSGMSNLPADHLRGAFMDGQYRRENSELGAVRAQVRVLNRLELIFSQPRDHTVGNLLTRFWNSWQQLARDPSRAARAAVSEQAGQLIHGFHSAIGQLEALERSLNGELEKQASGINEMGSRLVKLHERIAVRESDGESVSDLKDQRDLILDELSRLARVSIEPVHTGEVNVYIGGMEFVHGQKFHEIRAVTTKLASRPAVELVWGHSGGAVNFTGGELQSLIEARDVWIPESRGVLDQLAGALVAQVNTLHCQGATADGRTGQSFFDPRYVTADRIQLHARVADNPEQNIVAERTTAGRDVEIARALADLAEAPVSPDGRTTLNGFYDSVVSTVGMRSMEATDVTETRALLVQQLDHHRQSVMGASLDEELAKMVRFQHAYEAAARVITAMDEVVNTAMNGMGLAGR